MGRRKTLAGRTFALFFTLSVVVMIACTLAATAASFASYEQDAEEYLLDQSSAFAQTIADDADADAMCDHLQQMPLADTRCTLVDADGTVLFDNYADAATMENHADRAEISSARESGQGVTMRRSETLGTDTLYAASLVRDGIVLRLAETRTSLASFLGGMAWQLAASLVVIFLLSLLVARGLTTKVVRPLKEIDLSAPLDNEAYEELQPLLQRFDVQRRDLEESVAMRREFTGNVSHEMKSPLQVISGYAELIENGMVPAEDVPRFAGLIRSESESMRVLIDDVLTLSRLDEKGTAATEPVDLAAACRRVIDRLQPKAQGAEVLVSQSLSNDCLVMGNAGTAEQMIYNLIDNAITYSPAGTTVYVTLKHEEQAIALSVADEGPGIPDEFKERVFERFFRVDSSRSRETGGTGLGLAIVKHAAETMGGTVIVTDVNPHGANFQLTFPANV